MQVCAEPFGASEALGAGGEAAAGYGRCSQQRRQCHALSIIRAKTSCWQRLVAAACQPALHVHLQQPPAEYRYRYAEAGRQLLGGFALPASDARKCHVAAAQGRGIKRNPGDGAAILSVAPVAQRIFAPLPSRLVACRLEGFALGGLLG